MASGRPWTRDELFIALNLYHKLTFGQLHARQPAIVAVAEKLGRSSGSVAMKLCNLASLDPALRLRGRVGLSGASALDQAVWHEFHVDLNETVAASESAFRKLFADSDEEEVEVLPKIGVRIRHSAPSASTERQATVCQRLGQAYFREAVLNNFGSRCGITGLEVRELLIASHILPWSTHVEERCNVRNGLSLSRLHDAAFDQRLIAFDDQLRLLVAPQLREALPRKVIDDSFLAYEGHPLQLPEDSVHPDTEFLAIHRRRFLERSRSHDHK